MQTMLYKRPLPHPWRRIPYQATCDRFYHAKLHLVVLESIDDVPELGQQHHVSLSFQGATMRRPSDKERDMIADLFMDTKRPIEEDKPVFSPHVRHLWQAVRHD